MSTKQNAIYVKPYQVLEAVKTAHLKAGLDPRDLQYLDAVNLDYVPPKSTIVRGRSID